VYTLKILEDKEFDKLPYKYAKEALGCADPKTKTAYVRNTHWGEASKAINLLTIDHEIQELVAKTSPHEEDGIRYKKGGVLRNIVPFALGLIPGIGPILGAAANIGMNQYAQSKHPEQLGKPGNPLSIAMQGIGGYLGAKAVGGATSGFGAGWSAAGQNGGTLLNQVGSGLKGALTGTYTTPSGGTISLVNKSTGGPVGIFGGLNAGNAAGGGGGSSVMGTTAANANPTLLQQAVGGGLGTAAGVGATGVSTAASIGSLANPLTMLGLGSMALSALPTSVKSPDLGAITSKWLTADTVTKAGKVAQDIADIEYTGEWQPDKETTAYMDVMGKDISRAYADRMKQMDEMSAAVNDNWMRSGERLEVYTKMHEAEQREIDNMKAEWLQKSKTDYATKQYTYVMDRLNVDDTTKRDLLYGELATVLTKYNLQQEDLMNFRKIASDAGLYLAAKGMGLS